MRDDDFRAAFVRRLVFELHGTMRPADIAQTFGIPLRVVEQIIAELGTAAVACDSP